MLRLRSILFTTAVLLIAPLILAMAVSAYVLWDRPAAQGERVRGPEGLVGVRSGGAYAWVLPAGDDAVVVVDTGLDAEATSLRAEIRDREVRAVLLTHAHLEQIAGLGALGDVPVYVGAADAPLLRGEAQPEGWLARWFSLLATTMQGPPVAPAELRLVENGDTVELGPVSMRAIAVPGHSAGSIVWAHDDVLFTGGAVLASSPPQLMPAALSDDVEQAERSLEALLPYDFDYLADTHTGIVSNGRADLHRLVGAKLEPPTIRLQGPTEPGPLEGPEVEQAGLYVHARVPGADGLTPALLVLDTGEQWVLASEGEPPRAELVGRRVIVRGRLLAPHARPGLPSGLVLDVDDIQPELGQSSDRVQEPVSTEGELRRALHQWVTVRGTVRELVPLARGATFGSGQLELPDGTPLPLSAPMTIPVGEAVDLVARIQEVEGDLHISAARVTADAQGP